MQGYSKAGVILAMVALVFGIIALVLAGYTYKKYNDLIAGTIGTSGTTGTSNTSPASLTDLTNRVSKLETTTSKLTTDVATLNSIVRLTTKGVEITNPTTKALLGITPNELYYDFVISNGKNRIIQWLGGATSQDLVFQLNNSSNVATYRPLTLNIPI